MPAFNNTAERMENVTPQKKLPIKGLPSDLGKENFLAVLPEVVSA
jgi:hypothetical protein